MNPHLAMHPKDTALKRSAAALLMALCSMAAQAGPGAHGPNGEHLGVPTHTSGSQAGPASARLEAKSELFELVASLQAGRFSILIDRYDTNEPVLNAEVDVETGAVKARAVFQADQGGYAVNDAAFLRTVATPGEHALVFTVAAGKEADLLDGMLVTGSPAAVADDPGHAHEDGHDHGLERAAWAGAVVLGLGVFSLGAWLRQRRRPAVALTKSLP